MKNIYNLIFSASKDIEIANRIVGKIDNTIVSLGQMPNRGANLRNIVAYETDSKYIKSDNYVIIYDVNEKEKQVHVKYICATKSLSRLRFH